MLTAKKTILWAVGICLLLALAGCSSDEPVIAEFGPYTITLAEFRLSYLEVLKQPDVFDSPKLRESYLGELIDRRLIAEWAEKNQPMDEASIGRRTAYRNKCLREAHYKAVVEPEIRMDSALVDQVYAFLTQRRKLRHLFTDTQPAAAALYQRLTNGEDWFKLAAEIFTDQKLAQSGGELGWVSWDQLDFDLAMAAFSQTLSKFSEPVKSSFGWHILLVDNFEYNPLLSQDDMELHRKSTGKLVAQRIGEKIAAEKIAMMMQEVKIQINPQIMQVVGEHLRTILTRRPNEHNRLKEAQLTEDEQQQIGHDLKDYQNEVLAVIDGDELKVAEFINAMNYIPYEALHRSFKTVLDFAIRDFVLTRQAREMRLEEKYPFVDQKTRLYSDYMHQLQVKRRIARESVAGEADLRAWYNQRRDQLFKTVSFEEVRLQIEPIVTAQQQQKKVTEFVSHLRQAYPINKYIEPLHKFYDGIGKKQYL
jgi:parvulin-like peptidyl-prolyl isomerase